jgi:hypothetical protein
MVLCVWGICPRLDSKSPGLYAMASTGARLRKTFKYPSDSESSDASRDELDEEGKHLLPILESF